MKFHPEDRKFACSKCVRSFNNSGDLKIHLRIHTGEKPFACFKCDKTYKTSSQLKVHERTHTGEKPFSCYKFDKQFCQIGHLKTHERIHTGEKPFACSKCDKAFKTSLMKNTPIIVNLPPKYPITKNPVTSKELRPLPAPMWTVFARVSFEGFKGMPVVSGGDWHAA